MAQTPALRNHAGISIPYTPPTNPVAAGDVVMLGQVPAIATSPILVGERGAVDVQGVFAVPKDTSVFAAGDPVFWTPTGTPVSGAAGSGAAGSSGTFFMGWATLAQLTGDSYVYAALIGVPPAGGGTVTRAPGANTVAAGTTTADAGVLPAATAQTYPTTGADGTKGVRINVADKVTGRQIFIGNGVAAQALKIYAPPGGAINGAAADAAFVTASGKGAVLYCDDAVANLWLAW